MTDKRAIRVERRSYSYTIGIPMKIVKKLGLMTGDIFDVKTDGKNIIYTRRKND